MPKSNPGARVDRGDAVLHASKNADTSPVKKRFAAFAALHAKYLAAEKRVSKAHEALTKQQQTVAAADVVQDEAVDALAGALAGDGFPRTNPFKSFGVAAPAVVKGMGYGA